MSHSFGSCQRGDLQGKVYFFLEERTLRSAFIGEYITAFVTEEAVRADYEVQLALLPRIAKVRILRFRLDTKVPAAAVIKVPKASEDFASLARERSQNIVSMPKGGDLGFFANRESLPEIEAAVVNLQDGECTAKLIRGSFGCHALEVEERRKQPEPV